MNVEDVREGLRVRGVRRRAGTLTGQVSTTRQLLDASPRAEVLWDGDSVTRWALVAVLRELPAVTP